MIHASSRVSTIKNVPEEAGFELAGRIEVSGPEEIEEDDILKELGISGEGASTTTSSSAGTPRTGTPSQAFSRPKRPGRR